jgi:hypothetical protein
LRPARPLYCSLPRLLPMLVPGDAASFPASGRNPRNLSCRRCNLIGSDPGPAGAWLTSAIRPISAVVVQTGCRSACDAWQRVETETAAVSASCRRSAFCEDSTTGRGRQLIECEGAAVRRLIAFDHPGLSGWRDLNPRPLRPESGLDPLGNSVECRWRW